jgi:hypothetical protein
VTSIRHIPVGRRYTAPEQWPHMLAQSVLVLSLAVRIYDAYGVSTESLARARATVDRILKDADVTIAWPQCPCPAPLGRAELVVRILPASPAIEPGSLGFSYVDVGRRAGTLATVFADRVHTLAVITGVDEDELLGRAIAHELAHLLLGTHDHQHRGLMRGQWTASDISKQGPRDWVLLPAELTSIRRSVARRSREPAQPPVLTADADPSNDLNVQ